MTTPKKQEQRRPQGAPRHQFAPNLEFTDKAYRILEAAATMILHRLGLFESGYITKEDLIDHAWATVFFYVKNEHDLEERMYLNAQTAMFRYIKDKFGPLSYVPIEPEDEENERPPFDVEDPREMNDPAAIMAAVDEWAHFHEDFRQVVHECAARGLSLEDTNQRLWDCQLALVLLAQHRRFSRRDRQILRGCLIRGRTKKQVARQLHITRERVRQVLRDARAAAEKERLLPPPPQRKRRRYERPLS